MDPKILVDDEKTPRDQDGIMNVILTNYSESLSIRSKLEHQWTQNQKIFKGIPVFSERNHSSVRKRPKMRFRKAWSNSIRLLASLYQSFLLDKKKFTIKGFDDQDDYKQANVLEKMTEYRLNWLFRRRDGFIKFIWAFLDCISPGTGVVKVHWKYNEEFGIDEPCITNYPLEQVALDWTSSTVDNQRYAYLENYLTEEQMKEMGYENIDQAVRIEVPQSPLRDTRFHEIGDPLRSRDTSNGRNYESGSVGLNFPAPGTAEAGKTVRDQVQSRFRAVECFYRKDGKIWFAVVNPESRTYLVKPMVSPYGKVYPIAVGSLLLEAHKLVPEGIIQPLQGPQEDLNMTLNLRKDNQMLAMMGGWSVDKFGGVDTQALSNLRPGFVVKRNPGQGVIEPLRLPDVTQTSYIEANADQIMMDEMMGITPTKQGQSETNKTGVAAINLQESNAKESLYIATVGETLFRQVIYLLAYEIQLFETDEKIFRVANENVRAEKGIPREKFDNVFDIEFDMDVEINVGLNEASRAVELQRLFTFTNQALQSNNATALLLQSGVKIPNPTIVDVGQVLKDIADQLGIDKMSKYIIPVTPPPPPQAPQQGGGAQTQATAGAVAPQPNQETGPGDFADFLQQRLQGQ
jgi:hypothetical protein